MDKWIVDAGPCIHLDQIGLLSLLKRLSHLFIPPSVVQELTDARASAELATLAQWPNVTVMAARHDPTRSPTPAIKSPSLDRGELDCLRLALTMQPCVFLTDDLAARMVAEKLQIEVHGTVGLIAFAATRGWLAVATAQEGLRTLAQRSTLFITPEIIDEAIRRLKESA